MSDPENRTQSLACPSCGTHDHEVIATRHISGTIRRRRVCAENHRFTTIEVILDQANGILRVPIRFS